MAFQPTSKKQHSSITGQASRSVFTALEYICVVVLIVSQAVVAKVNETDVNIKTYDSSSIIDLSERGAGLAAAWAIPFITVANNFGTALTGIGQHCFGEKRYEGYSDVLDDFVVFEEGDTVYDKEEKRDLEIRSWSCVGQSFNALFSGVGTLATGAALLWASSLKRQEDENRYLDPKLSEVISKAAPGTYEKIGELVYSNKKFKGLFRGSGGPVMLGRKDEGGQLTSSVTYVDGVKRFPYNVEYSYNHKRLYEHNDISTEPNDYQDWSYGLLNYMINVNPTNSLCLNYYDTHTGDYFVEGYLGVADQTEDGIKWAVPPCWDGESVAQPLTSLDTLQ